MKQKIKDAVMASFIADALALGVHWVYDIAQIKDRYGRLEEMAAPELAPYHGAREKGQFTHYGDQTLVLLESIVEKQGFDSGHFRQAWLAMNKDYAGYVDGATKETLKNIAADPEMGRPGSMSSDLGGAARIAPLALFYGNDPDMFASKANAQTAMTHNQPAVLDTAVFFAVTASLVFNGEMPTIAFEKAMELMPEESPINPMIRAGIKSKDEETTPAIARFGQMCSVEGALPSTIHLIARYEQDLKQALVENIMAGGDSSARGLLAGFIIGAYQGLDQIPQTWLDDLQARQTILDLMDR